MQASRTPKAVANLRLEYEQAARNLRAETDTLLSRGVSEEQVGRWAMEQRNQLKTTYRDLTPPVLLAEFEARNVAKYGNSLGPSAEQLLASGKSWKDIIEAASRPGGADLNFSPPGFLK